MDVTETIFRYKVADYNKLELYGFQREENLYTYQTILPSSSFLLNVQITNQGKITTQVIDPTINEPYTLHLVDRAVGAFVGKIKSEYEEVLSDISENCFTKKVFQSEQAQAIISYCLEKYGDELEFLWKKFDDNAIIRRKDNKKWYFLIAVISRRKLGLDSDEKVEIIDLRMKLEDIEAKVDGKKYFGGYHMNKKSWVTICLDGTLPTKVIYQLIDDSYKLAIK